MVTMLEDLQMYKNFDELSRDVLDLAKEILPDQLIYLTSFTDTQQIILKLSDMDTNILLTEGMAINLEDTVCDRIDFHKKQPLVYEDIKKACPGDLKTTLEEANIKSYLGIPISRLNGERFGTLCAVHHKESQFNSKSIQLLQRIVRMFTYYLDLERFAFRDSLTELYNRHYLSKFFEADAHNGGALFFLDLDGFKKVNDMHGHDTGDLVLKDVAARLQGIVNDYNDAFVARWGGDEFIICFSGTVGQEEMKERADRLLTSLHLWNGDYQLSTSIGIAAFPAETDADLTTLLKKADQALYGAKTAGKNTYKFA
ncbi:diguanylate cyclase [Planococcus salinarum]|uniref:Diguanylate cyclase n=1 Tax=Planococcus salinarum TaxID=622695 RepID=A0ABX3D262_9BACL|nr:sensor domain-containing diguanylate cyclase [Planococcus salinarum]OHX51517.1 diguanylate cyclase [Planococcus salinarum]TAA71672.1 GGDEF domain-containing protein [Planococcus salinarum]